MIQALLFPETVNSEGTFDPTATKMSVSSLLNRYKKQEAKDFEKQNK